MNCACGGFTKTLTLRGEDYQQCVACGRCDPPKSLESARALAVWIRKQYSDVGGQQHIVVNSALVGFDVTDDIVGDALGILRNTMQIDAKVTYAGFGQ